METDLRQRRPKQRQLLPRRHLLRRQRRLHRQHPPQATVAEGLYVGATSTGRSFTGLIFEDGTYYVLYSATNDAAVIAGTTLGTGVISNRTFSSSNGRDINLEGWGVWA